MPTVSCTLKESCLFMAFIIEIMSQVLSLISTAFSRINCIFKLEERRMSTHGAAEVAVDALDDGRTFS